MRPLNTLLMLLTATAFGCGMSSKALVPVMAPIDLTAQKPLTEDHFQRDTVSGISEEELKAILEAPAFLEDGARLGVVPVATGYAPDPDLPLATVPAELSRSLESSGLFETATEVSTEWPADRGIGGLRELAARYRAEYLLLYRHRFVDHTWTNGWGWFYVTLIGALFVPAETIETAGVLEATLFEVKTGTLLFTSYERIRATRDENVWHHEQKRRALKTQLLAKAAAALAGEVVSKARRLAAARPKPAAVTER